MKRSSLKGHFILKPISWIWCAGGIALASLISVPLQAQTALPRVVINEVHHDATPKTERGEFVELFHAGESSVDLTGWRLVGVGNYLFPAGTILEPNAYLVIAEDRDTMESKFNVRTTHAYVGGLENDGEDLRLLNAQQEVVDQVEYKSGFPWPTGARGAGASMELIHPDMDNDLGGSWRSSSSGPTPGKRNSVYALNAPPQTRQVNHFPEQPRSGEPVTITAKVTDPDGVASVSLAYQVVDPGQYIRKEDDAYQEGWTVLPMSDDGRDEDAQAGDAVFTATLPAETQIHRRLVRYRLQVEDRLGRGVQLPYEDDESPNFAYFTYDGVPAWSGAKRPGSTPPQQFPASVMEDSLPVYHLLGNSRDVDNSQYHSSYNGRRMWGTLVYDGKVYDHIQFYNRGEASTYVSGKNKWRFKFNRARDFVPRDLYGRPYPALWKTLNLNACASPWVASNRGIAGLDEAVPHRLYQLAGVLGSDTHWIQFRVIDDAEEAPENQYRGDLWGLYLAIEHMDERFLQSRGMPDGSTYKVERNAGDKKNQGPDQSPGNEDWNAFWRSSDRRNTVSWWRTHFDLPRYYGFRAINRATGNVDLRDGANYYLYQHPNGRWSPMPWDLDMMYAPVKHIWSGVIRADRCLDHAQIRIEFQNKCRELLDLLFSDIDRQGGQAAQVVQELSLIVNPPDLERTMVDVDEFMWSYHPRTNGSHRGPWYRRTVNETRLANDYRRTIPSSDHEGFQQSIIDYMFDTRADGSFRVDDAIEDGYGFGYLSQEASESDIPDRPTIAYSGEADFPVHGIRFTSSAFSKGPGGAAFESMQWRIGEISNPATASYQDGDPWVYEIETVWESEALEAFEEEISIPVAVLRPDHSYRARVRHMNADGHTSHWSEPFEFVPRVPDLAQYRENLVISEIMYHPVQHPKAEYLECYNTGTETLDLTHLRFTKGIDFDFPPGTRIAPGEHILIVADRTVFESVYGTQHAVLGVWEEGDRLSNGGETIKLSYGAGITVHAFEYGTEAPWPKTADGGGYSLHLLSPRPGMDHALATNWAASQQIGGSPGRHDGISLAAWLEQYNLMESDAEQDPDEDGLPTLLEYGIGSHPLVADSQAIMKMERNSGEVRFLFPQDGAALQVNVLAEFSTDLIHWMPISAERIQEDAPGTWAVRPPEGALAQANGFFRLRAIRR